MFCVLDFFSVVIRYCAPLSEARPSHPTGWSAYSKAFTLSWEIADLLFQEVADVGRVNASKVYLYDRVMGVDWSK
jgi:hypothetical protein